VENEMLNASRLGGCDHSLTDGNLVRADVGAYVVNLADTLKRLLHRRPGFHITNEDILRAAGFDNMDLFGSMDEGAHWRASFNERLQDTATCFAC
jgi:hypothetical protein